MSNYFLVGGSSGIGQKLTGQLAEAGHEVYATYCKNKMESDHPSIQYHYLNVMEGDLSLGFLPDSLTGLVYCPGSIHLKPIERIKPSEFIEDYKLQVIGAVRIIQSVLSKLKNVEQASIVLFSTVAVQTGLPFHSQVSASKGAIEGLTKALAAELAPKIRVNCIAPSITDSPLASALLNTEQKKETNAARHPLKKIGSAKDIANMAEFLTSEKAGWITGQILHVDGGFSSLKI